MNILAAIKVIFILFVAAIVYACIPVFQERQKPTNGDKINPIVERLKHQNPDIIDYDLLDQLLKAVRFSNKNKIDYKTIDNIASLLAIPNEPHHVDLALAQMGKLTQDDVRHGIGPWGIIQGNLKQDIFRIYEARALGEIGPRARRAIPALDKALSEIRAIERRFIIRKNADSSYDICMAFYKIGGDSEVEKHDCDSDVFFRSDKPKAAR